jgi:hypothetical protein
MALVCVAIVVPLQAAPKVTVSVDQDLLSQSLSGRLYLFTSKREEQPPFTGPNWFSPEPFYAVDITLAPKTTVSLTGVIKGFPKTLADLPAGIYFFQALFDHDFYHSNHAQGAGNFYSEVVKIDWDGDNEFELRLSSVIAEKEFSGTKYHQQVRMVSPRLSAFFNRDVVQKATVVLPKSYYETTDKRYPIIYEISGFGGVHETMGRRHMQGSNPTGDAEVDFIHVYLDGQCKWGHHVYADSATNGPRGAALVEELVPEVARRYRTINAVEARYLTGHSSGGWSSFWLQVNYPGTFGGVWSTAPDPVDFRDYQEVNLYSAKPLSLYHNPTGERRPLARRGETPMIWYVDFGKMDDALGRGGQLRSFEAVFSPVDQQGNPILMWRRDNGQVIPSTVKYWREYDINLLIKRRWNTGLKEQLSGRLHVFMGTLDTFYLNGACDQIKATLKGLGSDAEIVMVNGKDHFNLMSPDMRQRIANEMAAQFLAYYRGK